MLPSWLRQLFEKRFTGSRKSSSRKQRLHLEPLEVREVPAVRVWTGDAIPPNNGNTNAWFAPRNWNGGVPQNGDTVIFNSGLDDAHQPPPTVNNNVVVFNTNSTIDIPNLTLENLVILDDQYRIDAATPTTLTITGNITYTDDTALAQIMGLSLIGPFAGSAQNLTLQFIGNPQSVTVSNANTALVIASPIVNGPSPPAGPNVGILKLGQGILSLSGVNTYTGTTEVNDGILAVFNASALGGTALGTVVRNGGTV